jgi:antitoxin VapB
MKEEREDMTLHIENAEALRLAKELVEQTGEPLDEAVIKAIRDRLHKESEIRRKRAAIKEIQRRVAALPVLDPRTPDEIIGYNEYGVPE